MTCPQCDAAMRQVGNWGQLAIYACDRCPQTILILLELSCRPDG